MSQKDGGKAMVKKLGDILGDNFMETQVFQERSGQMITNRKTGCKIVSFELSKLELLGGQYCVGIKTSW